MLVLLITLGASPISVSLCLAYVWCPTHACWISGQIRGRVGWVQCRQLGVELYLSDLSLTPPSGFWWGGVILKRGGADHLPPTQGPFYFPAEGTKRRPISCRCYIMCPVSVAPGQIPKAEHSHPALTPLAAQVNVSARETSGYRCGSSQIQPTF